MKAVCNFYPMKIFNILQGFEKNGLKKQRSMYNTLNSHRLINAGMSWKSTD